MSRPPPPPSSRFWKLVNVVTRAHAYLYRLPGGRLGRTIRGVPVLLLEHVGRKSGRLRTTPVFYLQDGDDLVIVASKGGVPEHPAWWLNLRASPTTTVQVAGEKRRVTARQADPEEKSRLWPRLVEMYPPYAEYQSHTTRDIPVVILSRAGTEQGT
jgi:deazaflavin-dependent oxidoreductase (nitroreductase family)